MVWKIAKKDFLLNIMTFRFAVGTVLCLLLMAVFMPVLLNDYQQRLALYSKNVADNEAELRKVKVYKNITPTVYRPPAVLSVFSEGVEKRLADSAKIELDTVPEIGAASASGNPYLSIFPVFDASLIFRVVISVLALLIAYDAVSGERERGTLKLIISGNVARHQVLFGKLLAGVMTLGLPVTAAFIVGVLILLLFPMVNLTGSDWARTGLIYLTTLVFVSAMYNVGLLFSCLARRSAISLVLGLLVWIVCAVVVPNGAVYLAAQLRELPAREKLNAKIASLGEELRSETIERRQRLPDDGFRGSQSDAHGAFGNSYHRLCHPIESYRKEYALTVPLQVKYADKFWEVEHGYLMSLFKQRYLAESLSRISPIFLYENALSTLAGTGLANSQGFMDGVRAYRNDVVEYIGSRTDHFTSSSLFTPCTEEEMHEYQSMFERLAQAQNEGDTATAYAAFRAWMEEKVENTPSLDLQDLPLFAHETSVLKSVRSAIADLALLTFVNALFLSLSFAALMRYDVR